jgi:hypothetical protein
MSKHSIAKSEKWSEHVNKSDYYDVDVTGIDGKKKLLPREVLAITSNQAKKSAEVVVR